MMRRRSHFHHLVRRVIAVTLGVGMMAAWMTTVSPAFADCTDPPAPDVNWRRCLLDGRDLNNAKLAGAMLRDATLGRAQIEGADFSNADGYRARFVSSNAKGAKFDGARLIEADFTRANLVGVSFKNADLRNARLIDADLRGADFTGAQLKGTDFRRSDLSGARWADGTRICAERSIGQCD